MICHNRYLSIPFTKALPAAIFGVTLTLRSSLCAEKRKTSELGADIG
jgi:hypothetical protein